MSDDDCLYDEDDDFYLDEFPYIEADDLAIHTVASPVWLDHDPSYETASIPSDWEYYSDEYWDEESVKKRKGVGDATEETATGYYSTGHGTGRRRRKLKRTGDVPGNSLGDSAVAAPTVVWKPKKDVLQPFEGPVVSEGQGERISLLKDWRERFKIPSKQKLPFSRPIGMQQTGSQNVVAVVVSSQSAQRVHEETLALTTHPNSYGLPSRIKSFQSDTDGTSSATHRTTRATPFQDIPPLENVQRQAVNGVRSLNIRKRKVRDSSRTPPTIDRASSATFKKRKWASVGENTEPTELEEVGESQAARRITALSTGKGILEVSDSANAPSRQKRKAELENEKSVQSSKRNTSSRMLASDIASGIRKDAGSPPSRRSRRKKLG